MKINWTSVVRRLLIAGAIAAGADLLYMQYLLQAAIFTNRLEVHDMAARVGSLQHEFAELKNSVATDVYRARLQPGQEPHIITNDGVKYYYPPRTNGDDGCHGQYVPIDELGTHYACAKRQSQ